MDAVITRRIRRSHFLMGGALFRFVSSEEGGPASSKSSFALGALGVAGAIGAAYSIFKGSDESDADLQEVIGQVESDTKEADEVFKSMETPNPEKKSIPTPKEEEPSFWKRITDAFKSEPKPIPVQESQVKKGAEVALDSRLSTLSRDFRSKFVFSGFSNADSLSKNGTYTKQEASTIAALKNSGVKTSVFGKIPKDIEERIRLYARKHSVDESLALGVAKIESGGNPNAISSTGAIGVFQLTGRTATELGVSNRFDSDQNIEAGVLYLKRNLGKLEENDLPKTPVNLYLTFQLGLAGAKELLRAALSGKTISQLSSRLQAAVRKNFGGNRVRTALEYVRLTESAIMSKIGSVSVASSSDQAPTVGSVPVAVSSSSVKSVAVIPQVDRLPDAPVFKEKAPPVEGAPPEKEMPPSGGASSKSRRTPQTMYRANNGILIGVP